MKLHASLILAAGLMVAADAPDKDLDKLQGDWSLVSLKLVDGPAISDGKLTIKGDNYEAKVGDFVIKATIKLDSSKDPKTIDFKYSEGPNPGETSKGIYKLDGDTFTFYRPFQGGGDRPMKIPPEPAEGMVLIVYKKAKP